MFALTALFLGIVFLWTEFYRFRRRSSGRICDIRNLEGDAAGLAGATLRVVTAEGREITAQASGCQLCVSRCEVGEMVSLVPCRGGYVLRSSWIRSGRRAGPERRSS